MIVLPLLLATMTNTSAPVWDESVACLDFFMKTYFLEDNLIYLSASKRVLPIWKMAAVENKTVVLYRDKNIRLGYLFKKHHYDVLINNLKRLNDLSEIFSHFSGYLRGKIVVTTHDTYEPNIRQIISKVWRLARAVNMVVLVKKKESISAYSWSPYKMGECSTVKTVTVIDEWKNGSFIKGEILYPPKDFTNLNGCEVFALTRKVTPYVLEPKIPYQFEDGFEIKLMEDVGKQHNMTIRYIPPQNEVNFWGGTDSQANNLGEMERLLSHELDLMFGGMMVREDRFEVTEAVYPYMVEELIWVCPKRNYETNFYSIFIAFSPLLWLMVALSDILAVFAFFFTRKIRNCDVEVYSKNFTSCLLLCFGIRFNISVAKPKSTRLRVLVMFYVIYAFHICTAFQSYLIFQLTHSERYQPIKSIAELADRGMTAHLFLSGSYQYNQSDHSTWNKILRPGGQIYVDGLNITTILIDIANNKSGFLLLPKSTALFLVNQIYLDGGKSVFEFLEYLTYSMTAYVSPGNPLREIFSNHIHNLIQQGIFQHWRKEIIQKNLATKKKKTHDDISSGKNQVLSMKHMEGTFLLWFILIVFSFIVFFLEIIYHNISVKRNLKPNIKKNFK